jgi:hypothetical protein
MELPFDFKQNVTQKVKCEYNQFAGSDPYPESAKQCFCDSSERMDMNEVVSQYNYFQGMLQIQRLRQSAAMATQRNDANQ